MGKSKLAPGFRFHPTDSELVMYYLKRKVLGKKFSVNAPIAEVDIYKFAPWDLPDKSCLKTGDLKWYFFCPIVKKYGKGGRLNRATDYGYWKTTGKDRPVEHNGEVVGMRKTLVFHQGKAPNGERTDWVMHEYKLEEKKLADRGIVQDSYVLCEVFEKDGMGPKNGAQYGAPFKEEDWSDEEDETNLPGTGSLCGIPVVAVGGASSSSVLESLCVGPSVESSGLYTPHPGTAYAATTFAHARPEVPLVADANSNSETVPAFFEDKVAQFARYEEPNVNISTLLDTFHADDAFLPYDGYQMELPQVSDEDNDVVLLLESFTEIDNLSNRSYTF